MREKGDDFSGRRRRFRERRGMILKRGEGKDFEGGGGRYSRFPCCVLSYLSWNTAGGGDYI